MNTKKTIEDRVKSLTEREEKLKLKLGNDSDEMTEKAKQVGKIALVAGGVALLGYFIFNVILGDDEEEEEKPKKKKVKHRNSESASSKITAFMLPYIGKYLDGIIGDELKKEKESETIKKTEEKEMN